MGTGRRDAAAASLRRARGIVGLCGGLGRSWAILILLAFTSGAYCFLGLVPSHGLRTVAIRNGDLMPELARSFEARGLAVRRASYGERTDPDAGTLVVRLFPDAEARGRVVMAIQPDRTYLRFAWNDLGRVLAATNSARLAYQARLLRERGASPDIADPVRRVELAPTGSDIVEAIAAERTSDGRSWIDILVPALALLPTLSLGCMCGVGCTGSFLANGHFGRFEGFSGSAATPGEVVAAHVLSQAGQAFLAACIGTAAAAGLSAWAGLGLGAGVAWVPPLTAVFAAVTGCAGIAGASAFRYMPLRVVAGGAAISAATALAYLPRIADALSIGAGWRQGVPFTGLAMGLVSGRASALEIAVSGATTAALGIGAFLMAARWTDARAYLRGA